MGRERKANPFFQAATEDEFLELALSDLPSYPSYYSRMSGYNVREARILGRLPTLYPLAPSEAWVRTQRDAVAIDARGLLEYASAHVPMSYCVPFGDSFGTWVGWLVDEGTPLVFVGAGSHREEMVRHMVRIGFDALEGYVDGGMDAWEDAGLPVSHLPTVSVEDLNTSMDASGTPELLDVRFEHEWRLGRIPEARHIELGDLPIEANALDPDSSYATLCAAGVRAATAASVLERSGMGNVSLVVGGTDAWRDAADPLES